MKKTLFVLSIIVVVIAVALMTVPFTDFYKFSEIRKHNDKLTKTIEEIHSQNRDLSYVNLNINLNPNFKIPISAYLSGYKINNLDYIKKNKIKVLNLRLNNYSKELLEKFVDYRFDYLRFEHFDKISKKMPKIRTKILHLHNSEIGNLNWVDLNELETLVLSKDTPEYIAQFAGNAKKKIEPDKKNLSNLGLLKNGKVKLTYKIKVNSLLKSLKPGDISSLEVYNLNEKINMDFLKKLQLQKFTCFRSGINIFSDFDTLKSLNITTSKKISTKSLKKLKNLKALTINSNRKIDFSFINKLNLIRLEVNTMPYAFYEDRTYELDLTFMAKNKTIKEFSGFLRVPSINSLIVLFLAIKVKSNS